MIDKILINRKLNELKKNLKILKDLKKITLDKLSGSIKDQWTIFYGLQISIQILIDIGNHILAAIGENQIEDYTDIIEKLGNLRIIPKNYANKIKGMPGLRNILVHEYGFIDIEIIYGILQNNLNDFEEFISYINTYMEKQK